MPSTTAHKQSSVSYRELPVVELIECITDASDRAALDEFHTNRKIFRLDAGEPMVMTTFIEMICHSRWAVSLAGCNYNLLEKTYNHLIDRFSNIPDDRYPDGPDCRCYFDAFLTHIYILFERDNINDRLSQELTAAKMLQNMVIRHFKYCLKESCRQSNLLRSRYQWDINGGSIIVWMPVFKSGSDRRHWLQANIDNPDPSRPDERYRIQQIIDTQLGIPVMQDFDSCGELFCDSRNRTENMNLPCAEQIEVKGLANAVADEKTENINQMRPAIQKLGKQKLSDLIGTIFRDVSYDCYEEKSIAERFGISRPTLSRFAGSRWNISASASCPDLWSNLARVLAQNTCFTEAAQDCGIWDKVLQTIQIKG